jgi:hypothetical protein
MESGVYKRLISTKSNLLENVKCEVTVISKFYLPLISGGKNCNMNVDGLIKPSHNALILCTKFKECITDCTLS